MPQKIEGAKSRFGGVLLSTIAVLIICGVTSLCAQAQTSKKIDQFGNINAEDAMARLDLFALELRSHPESRGIIVASNKAGSPRGAFLRLTYGYQNYLVNARGIEPARVRVIEENKRESNFELWTLPINQLSAVPERGTRPEPPAPELFDEIWIGPEAKCFSDLSIELYKLADVLRFLSEALRQHSQAKAWIVIHPSTRDSRTINLRAINRARQSLIKSGIKADRILTGVSSPRTGSCASVRVWLAPSSSMKTDEAGYYSQLMNEAESTQYTARRVEFSGNQHIRDNVLRKQFVQQEGDLFSRKLLDQSLKNFNNLGTLYPVTLNDIGARLDREEKLIDLTIYFRERRKR